MRRPHNRRDAEVERPQPRDPRPGRASAKPGDWRTALEAQANASRSWAVDEGLSSLQEVAFLGLHGPPGHLPLPAPGQVLRAGPSACRDVPRGTVCVAISVHACSGIHGSTLPRIPTALVTPSRKCMRPGCAPALLDDVLPESRTRLKAGAGLPSPLLGVSSRSAPWPSSEARLPLPRRKELQRAVQLLGETPFGRLDASLSCRASHVGLSARGLHARSRRSCGRWRRSRNARVFFSCMTPWKPRRLTRRPTEFRRVC